MAAREQAERELRATNEHLRDLSNRLLAVQEEERRSIARELHDQIGQYLTGLKLMLEGIRSRQGKNSRDELTNALSTLDELAESVQELSLSLRPQVLDDMGLLPALLWHIERYRAQTGITVDFRHSGIEERLPAAVETAIYRFVQEALTNIARHAGTKEATLQLLEDAQVSILVEDQGRGFDVEQALADHSSTGLSAMRERMELLGGHFTIESQPGLGTRVMAEVPLDDSGSIDDNA
jgi:signal transduction histidine kinase